MARISEFRGTASDEVGIRSRRTIGLAATNVDLNVACPLRGSDVPLGECAQCERCDGLHLDVSTGRPAVSCRAKAAETPFGAPAEGAPAPDEAPGASGTPVSVIMSEQVVCVRPDLPASALGRVLLGRGISCAPVVDDDGRALGVACQADLLAWLYENAGGADVVEDASVRDILRAPAVAVAGNESVAHAAAIMASEGIHALVVLGVRGQVIGVVTPQDVLRFFARMEGYVMDRRGPGPAA